MEKRIVFKIYVGLVTMQKKTKKKQKSKQKTKTKKQTRITICYSLFNRIHFIFKRKDETKYMNSIGEVITLQRDA